MEMFLLDWLMLMMEIVRKCNLIISIRNFIEYKDSFPIKDVCLMTSSNINHFIVHFEECNHLKLYMNEITSLSEYDINDSLDIILMNYIKHIIGMNIYNQYDVLLYKKLQKKMDRIKSNKNLYVDIDVVDNILGVIPPNEVLTLVKFSC